ncbi:MAG: TetR/AcrR family transcriptional regulator [Nitrososphaera sp.]|nr:TetR/AcrR family transcriptional regulator [Nitrososphaera sp.]MCI0705854.1 TetR/AcrR family transcriptional regulator [Ignavibacteriota bacterium]
MGIPERKEREKEQRREEIINAAQKVFFEKGLQAATMDEIAEAAELSKGTLYLYYKSKEDLYLAVMMRGIEILHNMFAEATSSQEPTVVQLMKLGDAYYEFFKQHRNYFRMFYFFQHPQFHKGVSEDMMMNCGEENQKVWKEVIGVIQRGIDEGVVRAELNPVETAVILWSSSNAIMTRMDTQMEYFKERMGVDLEEVLRKSNTLMLESILTEKAKRKHQALLMRSWPVAKVAVN